MGCGPACFTTEDSGRFLVFVLELLWRGGASALILRASGNQIKATSGEGNVYRKAATLDDLLRVVFEALLKS